jgi:hypothetical protein
MNLYNDASIIITPNGFKAGKLYAVKGADLDVTRATSATRVNANGIIETVGANVPRIDYTGGGCPSILVEPQRTNSILNSATVANQTIITGAVEYTLSFYGSGTITLSGTHTATVIGLGTARKTYTFTPTAGNLILTVSGTCTRGQLEAGSYATSYIPTTSASVTRNADVISKTGISSLIGQTEGTILFDFKYTQLDSNGLIPITIIQNSSNHAYFYIDGNESIIFDFIYAGSAVVNISTASGFAVKGQRYKIAFAYKQNDFVFYINGVQIGTDNSGLIPSFSELNFGYPYSSGYSYPSSINTVALWKTRLSNEKLAELTTI